MKIKDTLRRAVRRLRQCWMRVRPGEKPIGISGDMHLRIDPKAQEAIRKLMDRTEIRSPSGIFQRSLATFDVQTEFIENGGEVILRRPDGTESVFDPISFKIKKDDEE